MSVRGFLSPSAGSCGCACEQQILSCNLIDYCPITPKKQNSATANEFAQLYRISAEVCVCVCVCVCVRARARAHGADLVVAAHVRQCGTPGALPDGLRGEHVRLAHLAAVVANLHGALRFVIQSGGGHAGGAPQVSQVRRIHRNGPAVVRHVPRTALMSNLAAHFACVDRLRDRNTHVLWARVLLKLQGQLRKWQRSVL